jgi:hypothetical protein
MKKTLAALGAAFVLLAVLLFAPIVKVKGATPTNLFSVLITQSEIESTPIGASSPSTGAFTSLNASTGAFGSLSSNGGTLNGTIGTTTPNLGSFTSVLSSSLTPGNCVQAATAGLLVTTTSPCLASPTFTGSSGFQVLPSGLILEWGETTNFDTGPMTVSFPLQFPHACLMPPQLTDNSDVSTTSRIWLSGNCTVTGFTARNDGTGQAHWFAIGF